MNRNMKLAGIAVLLLCVAVVQGGAKAKDRGKKSKTGQARKKLSVALALTSADKLANALGQDFPKPPRKQPGWDEMTSAQKTKAERTYATALKKWNYKRKKYSGKKVLWTLFLGEIAEAGKNGYVVSARSRRGCLVKARFPKRFKDTLLRFKKSEFIEIEGVIKSCQFKPRAGQEKNAVIVDYTFEVLLKAKAVKKAAPKQITKFFGTEDSGDVVVYLIDRSGSMIDTFDSVRQELLRSINQLNEKQKFQIILFAKTTPKRFLKTPVVATAANKKKAKEFLYRQIVEGETNPVPAIQSAFAQMQASHARDRVVFLLTDGCFPDNQAVIRSLQKLNADKKAKVHTFLFGSAPKEAVTVMEDIADDNGGKYRFVKHDD
ncbi:MAG: VWA domain-containing protein [Phycisphaerae bacterium]|nr:VWA domain-containing protein [Phycisphaerae bacterium]